MIRLHSLRFKKLLNVLEDRFTTIKDEIIDVVTLSNIVLCQCVFVIHSTLLMHKELQCVNSYNRSQHAVICPEMYRSGICL